jgi:hypothetical protein
VHPDMLTFLSALLATAESGYLTLTAIHPDRKHPTPSRHIPLHDPRLVEHLAALLAANAGGWGGYFGVALRRNDLGRWRRGGQHDLLCLPALFVDVDRNTSDALQLIRSIRPPPSCIIHSGGGYHAYWYLDRPTKELAYAQLALTGLARTTGGDCLTTAQSMRLVGTQNHKPGRGGAVCRLIDHHPDRRYPLQEFATYIRQSPRKTRIYPVRHNLNPALVARVVHILRAEYGGRDSPSGWIAALCPAGHRHDYPGSHFYFNPMRGMGHCFGRHGRLLLRDLCPLLGIDPAAYGGLYLTDSRRLYG